MEGRAFPPAPAFLGEEREEWTDEELEEIATRRGRLRRFAKELVRNPTLLLGFSLLAAFIALATGEVLRVGTSVGNLVINYQWATGLIPPGPSLQHPFGVLRGLGVDGVDAALEATPWDLVIVGIVFLLAIPAGALVGTYAGYAGGPVDVLLTAWSDLILAVPPFFLVIVLLAGLAPFLLHDLFGAFVGLFGFVLFPYYARPIRARAERIAREPFVEAARASGASRSHILFRHILPNSLYPAFAQIPIDVYNIFFVLTVFPYVGCLSLLSGGSATWITPLPTHTFAEWGNLIAWGACFGWSFVPELNFWWMYLFPALLLLLFGAAVMLTCDGLEQLLHGRTHGD
jgi:peptide/nickel transport system permease protein